VRRRICAMGLDDAWLTAVRLTDSNVNVLIIIMENIVNMKNFVSNITLFLFIFPIIFSL
jgi:hypothetical protein